jgi:hypothetical protein
MTDGRSLPPPSACRFFSVLCSTSRGPLSFSVCVCFSRCDHTRHSRNALPSENPAGQKKPTDRLMADDGGEVDVGKADAPKETPEEPAGAATEQPVAGAADEPPSAPAEPEAAAAAEPEASVAESGVAVAEPEAAAPASEAAVAEPDASATADAAAVEQPIVAKEAAAPAEPPPPPAPVAEKLPQASVTLLHPNIKVDPKPLDREAIFSQYLEAHKQYAAQIPVK